jgi:hypothetical protein
MNYDVSQQELVGVWGSGSRRSPMGFGAGARSERGARSPKGAES